MRMLHRPAAAQDLGEYLRLAGGILCGLAFFFPWITYHLEGGALNITLTGWQTVIGDQSIFHFAANNALFIYTLGLPILVLSPFLLCMIAIAVCQAVFRSFDSFFRHPLIRFRVVWLVQIAALIEMLLLSYALDPLALIPGSEATVTNDPSPSIGSGLPMMYVGIAAVIIGGVLLSNRRQQSAHGVDTHR